MVLRASLALGVFALMYLYLADTMVYWETRLLSAALWALGLDHVAGNYYVLLLGIPKTFIVSAECSGIVSMSVLSALIAALWGSGALRRVAMGLAVLFAINMARILGAVLGYLAYGDAGLWSVHYVVGPLALYTAVLLIVTSHIRAQIRAGIG